MTHSIKIQPAIHDDLNSLTAIAKRCIVHLDKQGIYQWDDVYPSRKDFNIDILEHTLHVITSNSKVLGCICINQTEHPGYENADWYGSRFWVVHKLMVDPLNENQGIGKFAMQHAENQARRENLDSIRLDCFKNNFRANMFYQKLGYVLRGQTRFRKGMFNLYEKMLYQP